MRWSSGHQNKPGHSIVLSTYSHQPTQGIGSSTVFKCSGFPPTFIQQPRFKGLQMQLDQNYDRNLGLSRQLCGMCNWKEHAEKTKKDHAKMYPNHVYRPWPWRKFKSKDSQYSRRGDRATSRHSSQHPCLVQGSLPDIIPTDGCDASGQVCRFKADNL